MAKVYTCNCVVNISVELSDDEVSMDRNVNMSRICDKARSYLQGKFDGFEYDNGSKILNFDVDHINDVVETFDTIVCDKPIVILDNVVVVDRNDVPRTIVGHIGSEGHIPDLYVVFSGGIDDELYNDEVFIDNVMQELREVGYKGRKFMRAELGMQDDNLVVLEPGKDFTKWVIAKYGWVDLNERD